MCAKVAQKHETKEERVKNPSKGLRFYPKLRNNLKLSKIILKK
jgi:hypothetical protein